MFDQLAALQILEECTGDDIWPADYCRQRGVPQGWIDELRDCYESGFESDAHTIYTRDKIVNQFEGVRDVDLAVRICNYLGVDVERLLEQSLSRSHFVQLVKEAAEEG